MVLKRTQLKTNMETK